jgi:RND family efflux transporter MFP subunit
MSKPRLLMILAGVILVATLVVGRNLRQNKTDLLQNTYSGIVTVSGLVAKAEPFTPTIEETGTLVGNRESMIAAQTGGQVMQVFVDLGSKVRQGDPLVRLDDELLRLESERAKVAYDKAKMDLDRLDRLYQENSISQSDIENARLGVKGAEVGYQFALKTYNDATIRAPFSGTVAARLTEVGQMVERGMPVAQLVDVSSLKLTVQVSEENIKGVSTGSEVAVAVDAVGGSFPGKVTAVGSRAMTGSRTFPVEITLAGNDNLRSGMFARALLPLQTNDAGILLPRAAILPDAGRSVVFVARSKVAEKVPVRLQGSSGDRMAVLGVSPGDTVLTTGNQALVQGSLINLTLEP